MKKHLGITSLLAGLLLSGASAAPTNRDWIGGNGENLAWGTPGNWQDNTIPSLPNDAVRFLSGADLSVLIPTGSSAFSLVTQENTTVTFLLAPPTHPDTATLTLQSFFDVGNTSKTSGEGANVVIKGEGGIVQTSGFRVGVNKIHGNTLTFTDGVIASSSFADSSSIIGRDSFDNLLKVEGGANVTVNSLGIGRIVGNGNNRVEVSGSNSQFTVGGTGTQRGLRIGVGEGTSYANALYNNFVHVSDGGKLIVAPMQGKGTISARIGGGGKAHDNYIFIEGAGSQFILGSVSPTENHTTLVIGDAGETNHGGNFVEVRDGGSLLSDTGHSGTVTIYGHDSSAPEAEAANRLTVGEGGTVSVGGAIEVTGGLLQLSSKGSLTAASIKVGAGGRFEAAGDDFRTTGGETTIQNLGTLAVQEEGLSLRTSVTLANGAILELQLFDENMVAGIDFLAGGQLTISTTTTLQLMVADPTVLQLGATWQLFTGETLGNIVGTFDFTLADLPTLDNGLLWDYSRFNETDGWMLAVIPEPQSIAFLSVGFALMVLRAFPRKKQSCLS